jgi:ABC-type multidrug transport system fused ATPase/permease subunit
MESRTWLAWLRRFARTTPGVVGLTAIVIVVMCVIAAAVSSAQLERRIAERNAVLDRSEPLAYAAHNLYAALSAADAAAASGFLSNEIDTGPMRLRYQQALADASSALADATSGAIDVQTRTAMAEISAQLSTYTGLVESARTNDRQGFPVGSGYLREASSLMQNGLLPDAERIFAGDIATVETGQRAVAALPVAGLVLLAVVLAIIILGSIVVRGRTNRRFNIGLVVAAVAVVLAAGSIVVANRMAITDIEQSRSAGSQRLTELAQARIVALQARTGETLQLIARGDIADADVSFNDRIGELNTLLGDGPASAVAGVQKWSDGHRRHADAYRGGDYPAAVALAVGADPNASSAQFTVVESSLRDEIEKTRATLRTEMAEAGSRLVWIPIGVLTLMMLAAAAAVTGLWPRLKEFL